jgi:predicted RNA-binding protein YlqC (UPF0109 family)
VIYCFNFLFSFLVYLDPPAKQQKVEEEPTSVKQDAADEPQSTSDENEEAASAEVSNEKDSGNANEPDATSASEAKQEISSSELAIQTEDKQESLTTDAAKGDDALGLERASQSKVEEKAPESKSAATSPSAAQNNPLPGAQLNPSSAASAAAASNAAPNYGVPQNGKTANGLPPGLPTSQPTAVNPNVSAAVTNPESIVEERGEVSALYVGRVIGKGGEMIRDLQARSSCRIDVDQNVPAGQPRVITYRGTRKTVDFAKRLVQMLCSESASEGDLPLGEAKREFLVVPAQSVGKIIGRGGEMIRELQSRSQAKIQVDHSGNSGLDHSEKQVTITGTDQAVTKAREMVLLLVANPMMDAMQSINMLIEDKVHRGGVWGSGPPYPNLPSQGQNMQPNSAGGGGGGGGGYGYDQHYGGSHSAAPAYQAPAPSPYGAAAAPYAGAPPAYQQQAAQASFGQYGGAGGVEMEIFYIAKNFMGRIIGQKGVTINDLQRRSACDIQINQDVPAGQDCEISIRGSRQGIDMVKQMLREIIEIGEFVPVQRLFR